jgi:hypothetical protein
MSTYEEELMSNASLAALREDLYTPKNLTTKDASLLKTIATNAIQNCESSINNINQMLNDLKLYKECLVDSINIEAETADIAIKYGSSPSQQAHTLPGVVTVPSMYNIEAVRVDNARMEELKETSEKASNQKQMMFSTIQADYREFNAHFKKLMYADNTFDQFALALNNKLNPNY